MIARSRSSFFEYLLGGDFLGLSRKSRCISKTNPIFFKTINRMIDEGRFDHLDEMGKLSLLRQVEDKYFQLMCEGKCSKKAQTIALQELRQLCIRES